MILLAQPEQAAAQQAAVTTPPPSADAAAPTAEAAPTSAPGTGSSTRYKVKKGDCLSTIAKRHGMTWQELYKANKKAVGSNPNLIHPGLKLVIPS